MTVPMSDTWNADMTLEDGSRVVTPAELLLVRDRLPKSFGRRQYERYSIAVNKGAKIGIKTYVFELREVRMGRTLYTGWFIDRSNLLVSDLCKKDI